MLISQFGISSREDTCSGVYLMGDGEGNIIYVGRTIIFYKRMGSFAESTEFCLDDVFDIYFIKMDEEYCNGMEAVYIGIFQPHGNNIRYRFYDKWVQLIIEKKEEEMEFNLAAYYSFYLKENQTLMQFIMSCSYKTFSRRIIDGKAMTRVGGINEWYCMDSKKAGWAEPLIGLLNKQLQNDVLT